MCLAHTGLCPVHRRVNQRDSVKTTVTRASARHLFGLLAKDGFEFQGKKEPDLSQASRQDKRDTRRGLSEALSRGEGL